MATETITRMCSIENCLKQVHGYGLCSKHYTRLKKGKQVDAPDGLRNVTEAWNITTSEFAEYFWSKVDKTSGLGPDGDCWEWQASTSNKYGCIKIDGHTKRSHRIAWQLANGREPVLDVLHSCDNPPCCNPNHLREGTDKENQQDARDRGRWTPQQGSSHGNAIYTEEEVKNIKRWLVNGDSTATIQQRNAKVNRYFLSRLRLNKAWKHVTV